MTEVVGAETFTGNVADMLDAHRSGVSVETGVILAAANRRADHALYVGRVKAVGGATHIRDTGREAAVIEAMQASNAGPMKPEHVEMLARTLFAITCDLQSEATGLPIEAPQAAEIAPQAIFQPPFPDEL